MEELPAPPVGFNVDAIHRTCPARTRLVRIYHRSRRYPATWEAFRYFGPTASRFDHHTEPPRVQPRGILYAAVGPQSVASVLAEVFQATRVIELRRDEPWLAIFDLQREVRLLDTSGAWPVRAGGNMAINSGARAMSRAWSRAIYDGYAAVQGIWYPSSLTNQPCVALYERALGAIPSRPVLNEPLDSPKLRVGLLRHAKEINYLVSWPDP